MLHDKNLVCHDCKKRFVFSLGEQEFFNQKGLTNLPKRCPNCRVSAKFIRAGQSTDNLHNIHCATCGALAVVPFEPKEDRPVFCRACFIDNRARKEQDKDQATIAV